MIRFRRAAALSMLALCLQPLLPIRAFGCASSSYITAVTHRDGETAASVTDAPMGDMAMADMAMADMAMDRSPGDSGVRTTQTMNVSSESHSTVPRPCDQPSSTDACNAMGPCLSPVALASTTVVSLDTARIGAPRAAEPLPLRAGHAAAPELPPPRA
jgi:hypothetical protein